VEAFAGCGLLPDGADDESDWAAIANVVARAAFGRGPDMAWLVKCAAHLERAPHSAIRRWHDEVLRLVMDAPAAEQARWREALGQEPTRMPAGSNPPARVSVELITPEWDLPDALQVWSEDTIGFLDRGLWAPLDLLRGWSVVEWFDAVDRWQDPRFVQSALLFVEERVAVDYLLDMLRRARPCFTDSGRPTRAAAAVVLCKAFQAKARTLNSDPERVSDLLHNALSVVLQRIDGIPLGLALAAETMRQGNLGWGVDETAKVTHELMIRALRESRVPVKRQRELFALRQNEAKGRQGNVRRALPALLVAATTLDRSQADDVESLLDWLLDVLKTTEYWTDWGGQVNEVAAAFARAVVSIPNPAAKCRALYVALEARGTERDRRHDADFPKMLVLLVLAQLCSELPLPEAGEHIQFGRDRAFRAALTSASPVAPTVSPGEVVAIFLALGCARFGPLDSRAIDLVQPLAGDRDVLGRLLARLTATASGQELRSWLATVGRNAEDVVERAVEWAAATERPEDQQVAEWTRTALDPARDGGAAGASE